MKACMVELQDGDGRIVARLVLSLVADDDDAVCLQVHHLDDDGEEILKPGQDRFQVTSVEMTTSTMREFLADAAALLAHKAVVIDVEPSSS